MHNRVLLAKWLWWLGAERDSLWRKVVVVARFGEISARKSKETLVRHDCGVWKFIVMVSEDFLRLIHFTLELGVDLKF